MKKSNLKKILVIIFIFLIYFIYKENFKVSHISHISLEENKLCYITKNKNLHCSLGADRFNKKSLEKEKKDFLFLLTNVEKISSGKNFTCAIDTRHDLYCFGKNEFNQLGTGKRNDEMLPIKILSHAKEVSLGDYHACAIDEEKNLFCWGLAKNGQLGINFKKQKNTVNKPRQVELQNVKNVSCNRNATCVLLENNDISCWGENGDSNLYLPHENSDIKNINNFNLTTNGICLINSDSILRCFMLNTLKSVKDKNDFNKLKPFELKSVKKISSKLNNACILRNSDQVYCFGDNKDGQLGGINDNKDGVPSSFLSDEKAKEVYVGFGDVCAISKEDKVFCKGKNYYGDF